MPGDRVHGRALEELSDLCLLLEVDCGHLGDQEALVLRRGHQAFAGEVHHRLTHRCGGDSQRGREGRGGVQLALDQVAEDDRCPQGVRDGAPEASELLDRCQRDLARGHVGSSRRVLHSSKPSGYGSVGSSMYWAVPVPHARPVTLGTTASRSPTLVVPTIRPTKREPMKDSLTKSVSTGSSPRAWSCAMRALVPVPQGERSNQPGWMAIAWRECLECEPGGGGAWGETAWTPRLSARSGWTGSSAVFSASMIARPAASSRSF